VNDVIQSFEILLDTEFFVENERILTPLIDYFEDTWLGRSQRNRRRAPLFPIEMWNTYSATVENDARTNNSIEGWNKRFMSLMSAHHPTFWKFVEVLRTEQGHTEFVLNQTIAGNPPNAKRRKYRNLDQRLLNIVSKYGTMSADEYLKGIACNFNYQV